MGLDELAETCSSAFAFCKFKVAVLLNLTGVFLVRPFFKNPSGSRGRVPNFFILIGGFTTPLVIDFLAPRM
jgi:hypothetical protein